MKEKTADEMFQELGYNRKNLTDKWRRIWGIEYQNEKEWIGISLDHIDKEICIGTLDDYNAEPVYIGMQELQAINKKVKELGWYE